MGQRRAYLIKIHNIPEELVVNTDKTGIHLVSTGEARTWETQICKHVRVQGIEGKHQIIVVVSSATNDNILHFQVIFPKFDFKNPSF